MKVIDDFIRQYNKEFDYYQKLAQIVATKIEDQLFKRGIKAIVTNRAKKPERLKDKLIKRNEEKKYKTVEDIFLDIVDLAGVRVALYFPSERDIIDEIITDLFQIDKKKIFPQQAHTPKYEKRFSGYWATHYRIKLKPEKSTSRYLDTVAEVQVASVLMHAWSEVEHDLVYKPFSGDLSKEELAILDEINGLVLSGEIALERLQSAMAERTKQKKDITDKYELTNFLVNSVDKQYQNKIKLGDTFLLNNYLNTTKKLDTNDFINYISQINLNIDETVTDQLLNMLLVEYYDKASPDLKNYFKNLHVPDRKASGFESFVKCWVILEKAVREFNFDEEVENKKQIVPDFNKLKAARVLDNKEINNLMELRRVRNHLLHGIDTPSEDYLNDSYQTLKTITKKIIDNVPNEKVKEKLSAELHLI